MTLSELNKSLLGGTTYTIDVPNDRCQYFVIPTHLNIEFNQDRKEPLWEIYVPLKNDTWYRMGLLDIKIERNLLEASVSGFGAHVYKELDIDWMKEAPLPSTWNDDFDEGSEPNWKD